MTNKYLIRLVGFWFLFAMTGCNRGELNDVRDQMEENIRTAERIKKMQEQLLIDFANMKVLYETMEKKLYVTDIWNNPDGSYDLVYSDGNVIRLNNGRTPVVTFGDDGEVFVNGQPTGCRPEDGADGGRPEVTITDDGYWVVNGVVTDIKGIKGDDAGVPVISMDDEFYYCVDGVRVVPEISLAPKDGTDGSVPVPTIEWNATVAKYELKINGNSTVPPTYVSPEDGADAPDGGNVPYIRQVTMTPDNELLFIFSDGSTSRSQPVMLTDVYFKLSTGRVEGVLLDKYARITYTLKTKHATNPTYIQVVAAVNGWTVEVVQTDPTTSVGEIKLTPAWGGLTPAGVVLLGVVDAQGNMIIRRLEVNPASYMITVPELKNSYVYDVFTDGGLKVAEICKEYNRDADKVLTVVYPYDAVRDLYATGFVIDNGGTISHNGLFYVAGAEGGARNLLLETGEITMATRGQERARPKACLPEDVEENTYGVVKIAARYWTVRNLMTEHYRDGSRIAPFQKGVISREGYYAYMNKDREKYRPVLGTLYNLDAVSTGKLAPEGWHVSTLREWNDLINYLGKVNSGVRLKSVVEENAAGDGGWRFYDEICRGNNATGFMALPGGVYMLNDSDKEIGQAGYWWAGNGVAGMRFDHTDVEMTNPSAGDLCSIRCVKDY